MSTFPYSILLSIFTLIQLDCMSKDVNSEISILNQIRRDHFELGKPLDTLELQVIKESENHSVKKVASLIQVTYNLENFYKWADKDLFDLIYHNDWLDDTLTDQVEYLVIDDLFRICMASQRYKLFHKLNPKIFHNRWTNLLSVSYDTYIYLKTGSAYKFLDYQFKLKQLIVNNIDKHYNSLSSEVFERIKVNIISIGLANYDTLGYEKFYSTLKRYAKIDIDSTSSLEQVIYTQELSNYDIIEDFKKHNSILMLKICKEYCPTFLLNTSYYNINWTSESRKIFFKLLSINKYPSPISYIQYADFYLHDYINNKIENSNRYFILGEYDRNSAGLDQLSSEMPNLYYIDSLSSLGLFYEPNWLYLKFFNAYKDVSFNNFIATRESSNPRLNHAMSQKFINGRVSYFNLIKQKDVRALVDCSNTYFGQYLLLDYYYKTDNNILQYDTSKNSVYDSIFQILSYLKKTSFLNSNYYTVEKESMAVGILQSTEVIKNIFISSKRYDLLELFSSLLDISDYLSDTIYNELKIIKDKYRYLNFISTASNSEIKKFDSLFVNQLNKYINNPNRDTVQQQNRFYFNSDIAKNILIDIYNRAFIDDSLLVKYLVFQDLQYKITERMSEDHMVYNQGADSSLQAINKYENDYFCINNSEFLLDRDNNNTLYYKFFKDLDDFNRGYIFLDSSINGIWYFIAEDYRINNSNNIKWPDFDSTKLDLYVIHADSRNIIIRKLISLDSLNKIINLNNPKSNQFFSSIYFNEINNNSKILYDILIKPIEAVIDSQKNYKLILPTNLITLPLDYIIAKERNFLPHFSEFSDITSVLFKKDTLLYDEYDSTVVFSELIYNNTYCNINKAYSPAFRSGILDLKYSRIEKEGINKSTPIISFTGLNATKENFLKALLDKSKSNIHIITHGTYIPFMSSAYSDSSIDENTDRSNSYTPEIPAERQLLLFSSDSSRLLSQNNLLTSYEIKYLDNLSHIKLVFLYACETGLIDDNRTNVSGYSGFVKELLDRGVKSVIATRWKIQDKSAADFASLFYKNLKDLGEYSEAFYQTKLHYFKTKQNPFIWTSYVFVQ